MSRWTFSPESCFLDVFGLDFVECSYCGEKWNKEKVKEHSSYYSIGERVGEAAQIDDVEGCDTVLYVIRGRVEGGWGSGEVCSFTSQMGQIQTKSQNWVSQRLNYPCIITKHRYKEGDVQLQIY